MAAGITDLITRVTDSSTGRPAVTSLASPKALAAASVTINDGTNWTTEAAVYFAIYETTAAGMKIQSTQTDWKATRIGTTLSNLTLTGGTDRTYTAGAIVEQTPTARYAKDHYDWAMTHADQDGTLKAGAVDNAAVLASDVVTTPKIIDGAITNAKLSTAAGELGGAWQTWTPTWTNLTVGNGTVVARYTKVGKSIKYHISLVWGSTTALTGSFPTASLPVTAATLTISGWANFFYNDSGTANYVSGAPMGSALTSTPGLTALSTGSTYGSDIGISSTVPFLWTTNDKIFIAGEYETA